MSVTASFILIKVTNDRLIFFIQKKNRSLAKTDDVILFVIDKMKYIHILNFQLILTIQWQGVPALSTGESWQHWEWNGAGGHCVFQPVFGCFAPHPAKDTG